MRFSFLEEHRAIFRLARMCKMLGVSKAGYFRWRWRPDSPRTCQDRSLKASISALHAQSRQTYGSPRIHRDLRELGTRVSRKRVERLMREAEISARPPRRFVITTNSNHDFPIAPNLLQQDFSAASPNSRWVTDITYIPTSEGWLYLSAIMDLFSRRIVGWAMEASMDSRLVRRALDMAVERRRPSHGLVHHSDRGSQYASADYRSALAAKGIMPSMSRRACCYDNAAMESFFHTLKVELTHRHQFQTRDQAKRVVFEYIEVFYNRLRRHSSIGYVSPVAFEQRLAAAA